MTNEEIIYRAAHGRYKWWPILNLVDYYPKGKQKFTYTIFLSASNVSKEDAKEVAKRHSEKLKKKNES